MDLSQSFAELKRRNIRRLAVAGAIASLLLILAATMLLALLKQRPATEPHGVQQQLVIANVNNARRLTSPSTLPSFYWGSIFERPPSVHREPSNYLLSFATTPSRFSNAP